VVHPPAAPRNGSTGRAAGLVFGGLVLLFWLQAKTHPDSWLERSRLASVESLVERGTWAIDDSPLAEDTWDKVRIGTHFYSDKPPLLQAIAAVPYAILRHGFGIALSGSPCPSRAGCAYTWLTFLLIGVPSAAMLALLHGAVTVHAGSARRAWVTTAVVAFATPLWPYSLVFNNHAPAAAALFGGLVLLIGKAPVPAWKLLGAGALAGLSASFDLPTAIPFVGLLLLASRRGPRGLLLFAAGAALPAMASAALDWQITGSVLPPYFQVEGYHYPGSRFPPRLAGHARPASLALYAFEGTVGRRGFLAHTPTLLFGMAGLWTVLRRRGHPLRAAAAVVAASFALEVLYVLTLTFGHGGKAYAERFLVAPMPLVLFFVAFALPSGVRSPSKALGVGLFTFATAAGAVSACQGVQRTWHITPPVLYLAPWTRPPFVTVCSSLAEPLCLDRRRIRGSPETEPAPEASAPTATSGGD
jgi:hypothetical protein